MIKFLQKLINYTLVSFNSYINQILFITNKIFSHLTFSEVTNVK